MFHTQEVPGATWDACLLALSGQMWGRPVRVWVEHPDLGHQLLVDHMPLYGMSLIKKGAEKRAIELSFNEAQSQSHHLTHLITAPARIYLQESDTAQPICLWIDSLDGSNTLIGFDLSWAPKPGVRALGPATETPPSAQGR